MLSPASPPWERVSGCLISPSAITARCSSTAANKPRPSSRLLPVGGDTFDPEAGLMCPPTPQWVPAPASKSPPWLLISLCGAASHQSTRAGLCSGSPWPRASTGHCRQGCAKLQGQAGIAWDAVEWGREVPTTALQTPSCLEAKVSTSVLRAGFLLPNSSSFSKDTIFM